MSKKTTTRTIVNFDDDARIVVLPKGRENPRREGLPPHKRYEALLRSRTVGAFLKRQPGWRATIARAVRENRVRVTGATRSTLRVRVGGRPVGRRALRKSA